LSIREQTRTSERLKESSLCPHWTLQLTGVRRI
jgi:hypothetical protein